MANDQYIKVGKAKGRPMLTWVGKKPLTQVRAYPAQKIESFASAPSIPTGGVDWDSWPDHFEQGGLIFHGDNKDVLAHLLANGFRGKIRLIYIDPPFDSGANYVRAIQLRGVAGAQKIDGEEYSLGEQIQYSDIWANDNYLQFMYERLLLLKELLTEDGSLYLHCDYRKSSHLKLVLDEVFGADHFLNEITWIRTSSHNDTTGKFSKVKDSILFYSKGKNPVFNTQHLEYDDSYIDSEWEKLPDGRYYKCENMLDPQQKMKPFNFHGTIARWRTSLEKMEALWNAPDTGVPNSHGRIKLGRNGVPIKRCRIVFLDEVKGVQISDMWDDIPYIAGRAKESVDYPTQKPEKLLDRIITCSSNPGDIVFDAFCGSGTVATMAQRLGRRWLVSDINKRAIQTTVKRLQREIKRQEKVFLNKKQASLVDDSDANSSPCQVSFSCWRVNDYDLQIQHNEAVDLACEFIGITRTRTDSFFDGMRGKRIAKIIPFNHPLTPLDLESIKEELERRPEEERDVEVVALGMELAARAWLENYNRNRPVNKFHLIELRTDAKYGGFIKHEPLTASVSVKREGETLQVEVNDVFSPTIVKRLNLEQGLFRAQIEDWRAVVDCVLIDTAYDGQVFNITLTDVPEKKSDLVLGKYDLPAPPPGSTVAVKIIDMLGEELIVTHTV